MAGIHYFCIFPMNCLVLRKHRENTCLIALAHLMKSMKNRHTFLHVRSAWRQMFLDVVRHGIFASWRF